MNETHTETGPETIILGFRVEESITLSDIQTTS